MEDAQQRAAFDAFYARFQETELWADMGSTVEDSPWHREANVAVHTDMIVQHYLTHFVGQRTPKQRTLTLLAILFHDTGKPDAEEVKHSEERGTYRAYAGHEKLSAREWINFAMSAKDWLAPLDLSMEDISNVAFMIEHHLPYGLKNKQKRAALKTTIVSRLGSREPFYDLLRSDAAGRISDDHEAKLARVEEWIADFDADAYEPAIFANDTPLTAYVLSGPSGSGKSTFIKSIERGSHAVVYSLDACRLDFFDRITDDPKKAYADAWKYADEHEKEFAAYADLRWKEAVFEAGRSHNPLVIDNMNLGRKSRAKYTSYLMTAKPTFGGGENGWYVIGVSFYTPVSTIVRRQKSRTDKELPEHLVRDMYYRAEEFLLGTECHELWAIDGDANANG